VTPLVIDNFAGGGGASTGIERALGRAVDVAINHDPEAVAMHLANHPGTRHHCQSILAIDPLEATGGAPIALVWFSPDCKHHSKAKGGKPREKNIRDLAWVVPHWVERHQQAARRAGRADWKAAIRVIILENVEEFRKWGPLDAAGQPIRERQGEEFDLFVRRLQKLGGRVEHRELVACDFGAPTKRKRLYMVVRFDGLPIVWPEPTHGKPGSPEVESGARVPWRTAAECIDWAIPCPSIFDRARELKPATKRRIAHGVMRYVVEAAKPFVVANNTNNRPRAADEPAATITTGNRLFAADAAIVPITHHGSPERGISPDEPVPTVTAAHRGELARATVTLAPHVTKFPTGSVGSTGDAPMPTVTANGDSARPAGAAPLGLVGATMVQMGYGERDGQAPRAIDPDQPLGTIVASGGKHGVAVAHLEKFAENSRGRPFDEPIDTIMAGATRHAQVTAFLSTFYSHGGKHDVAEPAPTITAVSQHHAVVCAHVEQANTGMVGHPPTAPLSTIVGKGCTQRLVETTLIDEGALPPEQLERAVRVAAFLVKYYSNEVDGHGLDQPIGTVTTKDRFAVVTVTIDAVTYVIVDIGMRMLTRRELANAQGFPADYELAPLCDWARRDDGTWKRLPAPRPLPVSSSIRMIGNSVCPDMAEALAAANVPLAWFDEQGAEVAA
jgi:DNA (cytosine-5)-methyltransferase 1